MNDIVNIVSEISKSLLRLCFGMFLVWLGFTIHNLSKKDKVKEPVYIENKTYNNNEEKAKVLLDSISKLPPNEQLELVRKYAEEYKRHN